MKIFYSIILILLFLGLFLIGFFKGGGWAWLLGTLLGAAISIPFCIFILKPILDKIFDKE